MKKRLMAPTTALGRRRRSTATEAWQIAQRVADRHVRPMTAALVVALSGSNVSLEQLEAALARGDRSAVERIALGGVDGDALMTLSSATTRVLAQRTGLANSYSTIMKESADASRCLTRPTTERIERAATSYGATNVSHQAIIEANLRRVAVMTGGAIVDGMAPVDIVSDAGERLHGIDVKTFINNKTDVVTTDRRSRGRKNRWAKRESATLHTVVVDDRLNGAPSLYSGNQIYYRRGTGTFSLAQTFPIRDAANLREMMLKTPNELAQLRVQIGSVTNLLTEAE